MAPLLLEAGELAPLDDVMRMRTLHMTNSPDTIPLGAARTFAAMLQHVNGGEVTDSHRHTATSVYFAIQGSGIYTTAEGEQQFMEPGDLLTQPSWTWHGTTNSGSEPAIWFTAMDTSLMQFLDNWENQRYPESFSQPITKPDGFHMKRLGALRAPGRARWAWAVSGEIPLVGDIERIERSGGGGSSRSIRWRRCGIPQSARRRSDDGDDELPDSTARSRRADAARIVIPAIRFTMWCAARVLPRSAKAEPLKSTCRGASATASMCRHGTGIDLSTRPVPKTRFFSRSRTGHCSMRSVFTAKNFKIPSGDGARPRHQAKRRSIMPAPAGIQVRFRFVCKRRDSGLRRNDEMTSRLPVIVGTDE